MIVFNLLNRADWIWFHLATKKNKVKISNLIASNSSGANFRINLQDNDFSLDSIMTEPAKVSLLLQPPAAFNVEIDGGSFNAERWANRLSDFKNYLKASNIANDSQKVALFLYASGTRVAEIYRAKKGNSRDFSVLQFRHLKQFPGECIEAFIVRLLKNAAACSFGDRIEDELKIQLIEGCLDKRIKLDAAKGDCILTSLTTYARSLERSAELLLGGQLTFKKDQVSVKIESANQVGTQNNFRTAGKQKNSNSNECGNCGNNLPHRNGSCPAKGVECRK